MAWQGAIDTSGNEEEEKRKSREAIQHKQPVSYNPPAESGGDGGGGDHHDSGYHRPAEPVYTAPEEPQEEEHHEEEHAAKKPAPPVYTAPETTAEATENIDIEVKPEQKKPEEEETIVLTDTSTGPAATGADASQTKTALTEEEEKQPDWMTYGAGTGRKSGEERAEKTAQYKPPAEPKTAGNMVPVTQHGMKGAALEEQWFPQPTKPVPTTGGGAAYVPPEKVEAPQSDIDRALAYNEDMRRQQAMERANEQWRALQGSLAAAREYSTGQSEANAEDMRRQLALENSQRMAAEREAQQRLAAYYNALNTANTEDQRRADALARSNQMAAEREAAVRNSVAAAQADTGSRQPTGLQDVPITVPTVTPDEAIQWNADNEQGWNDAYAAADAEEQAQADSDKWVQDEAQRIYEEMTKPSLTYDYTPYSPDLPDITDTRNPYFAHQGEGWAELTGAIENDLGPMREWRQEGYAEAQKQQGWTERDRRAYADYYAQQKLAEQQAAAPMTDTEKMRHQPGYSYVPPTTPAGTTTPTTPPTTAGNGRSGADAALEDIMNGGNGTPSGTPGGTTPKPTEEPAGNTGTGTGNTAGGTGTGGTGTGSENGTSTAGTGDKTVPPGSQYFRPSYGQDMEKGVKAPYRKGGYSEQELIDMGNKAWGKDRYTKDNLYEGYYIAPDRQYYPVDQIKANYYKRYGTYNGWEEGMRDYWNTFGTFYGYRPNWQTGRGGGGRRYYGGGGGSSYGKGGSSSGNNSSNNGGIYWNANTSWSI